MQVTERLANIQFEHLVWFNELQQYQEEIKVYLRRIKSLLTQYDDDLTDQLEGFGRKFEELHQQIEGWQIKIGQHEVLISEMAKLNGSFDQMTNSEHEKMRNEIGQFRRSVIELKEAFQYLMLHKM